MEPTTDRAGTPVPAADEILDRYLDRFLSGERVAIDELCAAEPELEDFERASLQRVAATLEARSSATADIGRLPRSIGPYNILGELGGGGQAVVYLAQDQRLPRRVALKVFRHVHRGGSAHGDPIARLKREAGVLARLDHPGICGVYEIGREGAGEGSELHWIAMRHVEGQTLSARITAARLRRASAAATDVRQNGNGLASSESIERSVLVIEKAARALHAAHEAGVVHRDVKPSNILVTTLHEPVLLDFGLARDEHSEDPALTVTGEVFGTPAYMSPEQLERGSGRVDRQTDVYALGVTLYECLTLERPFQAPTPERLYWLIRRSDAPDARRVNRAIPRDLAVVLATALEKDPARRYQTALDLADELRRVREHQPIQARAAGPWRRLTRWTKRNPVLALTTFGLVFFLVAGLAVTSLLLGWERAARLQADGSRLVAEARALLAENPGLSLLLAIEGAERAGGRTADEALLAALGALREVRTVRAHEDTLLTCASSADGRRIATGSADGTASVWDAQSGARLALYVTGPERVDNLALRSDGALLATSSCDGRLALWDVESGALLHDLAAAGSGPPVSQLEFHPDGRSLLTAEYRGKVQLWDVARGVSLRTLESQGHDLSQAVFSDDGRRLALLDALLGARVFDFSGAEPRALFDVPDTRHTLFSPDGSLFYAACGPTVRILDAGDGSERATIAGLVEPSPVMALSADGKHLFAARDGGDGGVFDARTGAQVCAITGRARMLTLATFSRDGRWLLTADSDLGVYLFDAATGRERASFRGHELSIGLVAFAPDGLAVTASSDSTLRWWRAESGAERHVLATTFEPLSAHFDPAGARIVVTGRSGKVQVFDVATHAELLSFQASTREVMSAVFSPDGRRILTASRDGRALLWDAREGTLALVLPHRAPVWDAQFSADGRRIVTSAEDYRARLWDVESGALELELLGQGGIRSASFSADGGRVVTSSEEDATVRLWDACTGQELRVLHAPLNRPITARLDPSGRFVVAGYWNSGASVWNVATGELVRRLLPDLLSELSAPFVAFSPDGSTILTAHPDFTARLWDASSGEERMNLEGHQGSLVCADFSADGKSIVTCANDGTVRLWPVTPLEEARASRWRELTASERERYGLGRR